jgi:hypothetical protein
MVNQRLISPDFHPEMAADAIITEIKDLAIST